MASYINRCTIIRAKQIESTQKDNEIAAYKVSILSENELETNYGKDTYFSEAPPGLLCISDCVLTAGLPQPYFLWHYCKFPEITQQNCKDKGHLES